MKQIYNPRVKTYGTQIKTAVTEEVNLSAPVNNRFRGNLTLILGILVLQLFSLSILAQPVIPNCGTSGTDNVRRNKNENTYYPGAQANVPAGSSSILLGPAGTGTDFGLDNITKGDILLIIQMQGAQIIVPPVTNSAYGSGTGLGAGFTSTGLSAGNMEFVVASGPVPTTGGTLNLISPLTYSYQNSAFGTNGQYTYQVILIQPHFSIILTGNITTPLWNGSSGGVTVLSATSNFNFSGFSIKAKGAGFRGGGGRAFNGQSGAYTFQDFYTLSTANTNGSKGEGIAGTPRYLNFNNSLVGSTSTPEGYPSGSYGRGAPGNAGGGATDSDPVANDQNAGGGGGGNGGTGGTGGNGWSTFKPSGGRGGTSFTSYSPMVNYYSPSRLILGGGGGAGSTNNATGTPGSGFASSGAAGGGIVIINALTITGTGTIDASGLTGNSTVQIDGSGGGGAGGSILIFANSGQSGIIAKADGGDGGSNYPDFSDATQHGPGGGGGGGVIFSNGTLNPASSANGGAAGVSYGFTITSTYNATDGNAGVLTQTFPFTQLPPNMEICQIQVLPVTITDFNATYVSSNNVKVSWSTTNEINASYYVVERSTNAEDFIPVGQVNMSQSLNPVHNYNLNDQLYNVNSNIVYYRLRIVDNSGKFSYSKVVPVKLDQPVTGFSLYPNPIDNYTILNVFSDKQSMGVLRVIDNSGRQILTKSISVNNGSNSIMVDQLGYLPKGVYMVQVLLNNNLYNQKLLKK